MKKLFIILSVITLFACATDVEITLPRGPQGEQGPKGDPGRDGLTPYIKDGNWWIGESDTGVRAIGVDGEDGVNGEDGDVPYIKKGYWWIAGVNTGVPARGKDGKDGKDGLSAYELWLKAGNHGSMKDFLRSLKGRDGEDGKDGLTPFIRNGYWWIGDYNTRIRATGEDGKDGEDGDKGEKGASAYDLWKKEVNKGLENTRKDLYDNRNWPMNRTTLDDFWDYLSGMDGINGKDGEDGQDLDKPDAAYIDLPRNLHDAFNAGMGIVTTISANYPWTYKIITEQNKTAGWEEYLKVTNVTYKTAYGMPDGSKFETNNGSISIQVLKLPAEDMKFEFRFETHNGDYTWIHNSWVVTIHAANASRAIGKEQGDGYIHLNPNIN